MTEAKHKRQPQAAEPTLFMQSPLAGAANEDDFVDDVVGVVAQLAPDLTPEQCAKIGAEVRLRWGGDRPYIARRQGEGRSGRNEAIRRDYLSGERLALLERRYNLTQRRLLQIIKE